MACVFWGFRTRKSSLVQFDSVIDGGQLLEDIKGFLIKSNARASETADAKLNMLDKIGKYGWKYYYVKDREQIVKGMTVQRIKDFSEKYLNGTK